MGHYPGNEMFSGKKEKLRSGDNSKPSDQELLDFTFSEIDRLSRKLGEDDPDVQQLRENATELSRRITGR